MFVMDVDKAVFIDLDGTMLTDKYELSPRTIEAVNRIKTLGYETVVCTGRAFNRAKQYSIALGGKYIIFANGGGIYDCQTKKVLHENAMSKSEILELYGTAKRNNVDVWYNSGGTRWVMDENSPTNKGIANVPQKVIKEPLETWLDTNKVLKLIIVSPDFEAIQNIKETIEKTLLPKLLKVKMIEQSKSLSDKSFPKERFTFYSLANVDSSKGDGVRRLCKMLRISKENRIGIGDDINDFSLFEECGYSVAVGNALPELKKVANYVTADNNSDGVAKFLETLTK